MIRTIVGFVAVLAAGPGGYAGGAARQPAARLTLSYTAEAGYAAAVKLDCGPVGGGHPKGAQACRTLDAAGGDPDKIPPAHTLCYLVYAPIDAEMAGTWRGKAVHWQHHYGNICEMRRDTGVLFAF
jgi:hypothetical protein